MHVCAGGWRCFKNIVNRINTFLKVHTNESLNSLPFRTHTERLRRREVLSKNMERNNSVFRFDSFAFSIWLQFCLLFLMRKANKISPKNNSIFQMQIIKISSIGGENISHSEMVEVVVEESKSFWNCNAQIAKRTGSCLFPHTFAQCIFKNVWNKCDKYRVSATKDKLINWLGQLLPWVDNNFIVIWQPIIPAHIWADAFVTTRTKKSSAGKGGGSDFVWIVF